MDDRFLFVNTVQYSRSAEERRDTRERLSEKWCALLGLEDLRCPSCQDKQAENEESFY